MSKNKILVVDDEPLLIKMIIKALENEPYDIFSAYSGAEGLRLYAEYKPQLIILDLMMPEMSGLEFLYHLKPKPLDPFIIVLTGYGSDDEIKKCFQNDVNVFLRKPFNIYELIGVVNNAIASKEAKDELEKNHHFLETLVEERTAELSKEITERKTAEKALETRLMYERILNKIITLSMSETEIEIFLNAALRIVGETLDIKQVAIFRYDSTQKIIEKTVQWPAVPAAPQNKDGCRQPSDTARWLINQTNKNEIISYNNVKNIPDTNTKEMFLTQEVKSFLAIPLFVEKEYYGFIGFEESKLHCKWQDENTNILRAMAQFIAGRIELKYTEIKKKEIEALNIQKSKLASLGTLSVGLAHELRNPLAVISSCAQFCLEKIILDQPLLKENFQIIYRNAQKANQLIWDLLSFARPSILKKKALSLNELVIKMLTMAKLEMNSIHISFVQILDDQLPLISCDEEKLGQVFLNLILNAIQANDGKGMVTIRTRFMEAENQVEVDVTNDGSGIPEEYVSLIFNPFFTTKDTGTGLGLSVSHTIVQQHDGMLFVRVNTPSETTMTVRLPVAQKCSHPDSE